MNIDDNSSTKILGIGDVGNSVLNYLIDEGITHFDLVAINTSNQALKASKAKIRVQLGDSGNDAGGKAEIGRKAAEESIDELYELLFFTTRAIYIIAGMGRGTGGGASPVIARVASQASAKTIAVVSRPFSFEDSIRRKTADQNLKLLENTVDELIVIENDRLRFITERLSRQKHMTFAIRMLAWRVISHLFDST